MTKVSTGCRGWTQYSQGHCWSPACDWLEVAVTCSSFSLGSKASTDFSAESAGKPRIIRKYIYKKEREKKRKKHKKTEKKREDDELVVRNNTQSFTLRTRPLYCQMVSTWSFSQCCKCRVRRCEWRSRGTVVTPYDMAYTLSIHPKLGENIREVSPIHCQHNSV